MAATAPTPAMTQKAGRRAFAAAEDRHRCGRRRQQRDDDGAVAGGDGGERERGQQREADDDPAGDDGQARPLDAARQALPGEGEGARGEDGGDDRAAGADEQRVTARRPPPG